VDAEMLADLHVMADVVGQEGARGQQAVD
jgi:hypothetical protein